MATVDKAIADRIIAGEFADDGGWPVRIVEYDNDFGGTGYGVEMESELHKYEASRFVRNPRPYWIRSDWEAYFGCQGAKRDVRYREPGTGYLDEDEEFARKNPDFGKE